jgi:hypothetical protein
MTTIWSGRSKSPEKDFLWELNPYKAFQTLTFRHFRRVHCSPLFSKWDPKGQKTEAKIAYRLSGSSNIICTRFWHSSTLPPTIAEAGGKYCTHHTNKNFCKRVKIWLPWQEFCMGYLQLKIIWASLHDWRQQQNCKKMMHLQSSRSWLSSSEVDELQSKKVTNVKPTWHSSCTELATDDCEMACDLIVVAGISCNCCNAMWSNSCSTCMCWSCCSATLKNPKTAPWERECDGNKALFSVCF